VALLDPTWHDRVDMAEETDQVEVKIGPQGRLVIPASLRRTLGIQPGQKMVAKAEEGRLILETKEQILSRLQSRFAHVPKSVSLADELIAERRLESKRERA
jgi:AbrB family looped-hinge helix DNA binding protein